MKGVFLNKPGSFVDKLNFYRILTSAIFINNFIKKLANMRRLLTHCGLLIVGATICVSTMAQQSTTVSGSVKNVKTKEAISAVSVTVKGTSTGTFTDDKGNFKFSTSLKLPLTLVFSSVGYTNKEVVFTTNNQSLSIDLETSFVLGDEVGRERVRMNYRF